MAWNGSGSFIRTDGTRTGSTVWAQAKAAVSKILAADHDTHDEDLATGLENCLTRDAQNSPSADLPMAGFKHTNVGAAAARTDYARTSQVQDSSFQWLGTSGGSSNAYTGSLTPAITAYAAGQTFRFLANHTNTGAATLDINSLGATAIRKVDGGTALQAGDILSASIVEVVYDGSRFLLVGLYALTYNSSAEGILQPSVVNVSSSGLRWKVSGAGQFVLNMNGADRVYWDSAGTQTPGANRTYDLGTSSLYFRHAYVQNVVQYVVGAISAAGTVQGDATDLTGTYNVITTCAAGAGVMLPDVDSGTAVLVVNNQPTNTMKVYPRSGQTINAGATNASVTLTQSNLRVFYKTGTNEWWSP